jgi:hypothetical protein
MITRAPATEDVKALLGVVQDYFDALYEGDTELFARVLHPSVRLFGAADNPNVELDFASYLDRVRNRPSPASRNDPRHDQVLSIDMSSPTTAHVRVRTALLPRLFTDDLTFVKTGSGWKIVAKVWHYEEVKV